MLKRIIQLIEAGYGLPYDKIKRGELEGLTNCFFDYLSENPREGWFTHAFESEFDQLIISVSYRKAGTPYAKPILTYSIYQGMV